jgi:tetratricopeptide (TPR) repeat protein
LAALLLASGCGGLNLQQPWTEARLTMDDVSIADVQGPEERRLRSMSRQRINEAREEAPTPELAAQFAELESAQKLYDEGRYPEAEQAFTTLVKKSKPSRWSWGRKKPASYEEGYMYDDGRSPVEEDGLFMVAQCQFMQGRLSDAEESYAKLLKDYPSTRHLDTVSRQLFRISREWLGFPDEADQEIVQVAYGEQAPSLEQRRTGSEGGWLPNLTDKTRPAFDVDGRALGALRLIWLHDAAGPLADDALMMAANYHLRSGNHIEAAQHYRLLREQFPDSPHMRDSLMLGSHVLLASYNGPGYDPTPLEEAKQLKLMALQYPDLSAADRERLQQELEQLEEAEVAPLWKDIEFYLAKRQPQSVVLHCNYLIAKHPNSKYAKMAMDVKQRLEAEGKIPPGWPYVDRQDPQAPPAQPERSEAADSAQQGVDVTAPADEANPQEPRRLFPRLLRKTEEAPELQPIDEGAHQSDENTPDESEAAGRVRLQSW